MDILESSRLGCCYLMKEDKGLTILSKDIAASIKILLQLLTKSVITVLIASVFVF